MKSKKALARRAAAQANRAQAKAIRYMAHYGAALRLNLRTMELEPTTGGR